jgi:hypothetical protein
MMPVVRRCLVALLLIGCSSDASSELQVRGAQDLNCADSQVVVTRIDDSNYLVTGCGKRLYYKESCDQLPGAANQCTLNPSIDQPR